MGRKSPLTLRAAFLAVTVWAAVVWLAATVGWPGERARIQENFQEAARRIEAAFGLLPGLEPPADCDGLLGPGVIPPCVDRTRYEPLSAYFLDRKLAPPRPILPDPWGRALRVAFIEGVGIEVRSSGSDGVFSGGAAGRGDDLVHRIPWRAP